MKKLLMLVLLFSQAVQAQRINPAIVHSDGKEARLLKVSTPLSNEEVDLLKKWG